MPTVDLSGLEPVDYDPFQQVPGPMAQPDLTAAARAGQLGTLSAGDQSWGQNIAGGFSNAMGALGATPQGQRNAYDIAQTTEGSIPGLNNLVSGNQAYRDYNQGNYLGALSNAVAAMPIPGVGLMLDESGNVVRGALKKATMGGPISIMKGDVETPGILAYHGSPTKFDQFDPNFLGTGTGVTNEGEGIYTSADPKIARTYRAGDPHDMGQDLYNVVDPSGNIVKTAGGPGESILKDKLEYGQGVDWDQIRSNILQHRDSSYTAPEYKSDFDAAHALSYDWENQGYKVQKNRGNVYQVAIHDDPDSYMHWDIPISEQSEGVQKAVDNLPIKTTGDMTGEDVMDALRQHPDVGWNSATDELNKAGIPGMRYIDETWRGKKNMMDGPTNYVAFNPQNVQILKRYGLMGGLGAAGALPLLKQHGDVYQTEQTD